MSISSRSACKVRWEKTKLGAAFSALLVLLVTAGISSQASPSVTDLPSDQKVLAFLTESIDWYRHRAMEERLVTEPADVVFLQDNRPIAAQIVQLSFDFARADASLAATLQAGNPKASAVIASHCSPDLAQFVQRERSIELESRQASQEIETIKKKLLTAHGAERRTLQATLDVTQSRLDVLQAGSATLQQLIEFGRVFGGHEDGDLPASIDNLARTVPDVIGPAVVGSQRQTSDLAAVSKSQVSGIFGLGSEVSALGRKLQILDDEVSLTDKLRQSSDTLRTPLIASINKQRILSGTDIDLQTTDLSALQQQKARLDQFAALVKEFSPIIVALDKQQVLLAAYALHLKSWRAAIVSEDEKTWENLMLRLAGVAVVIGALLLIGGIARGAIRRHEHDVDRRHIMLVIQRVVVWFTIVVVTAFAFASDLTSLATFFGLVTAGVAVALQSVIVSALGYFMLVGRHGIKLGNRVQISGVTGDVADISWLQFQVREVDKKTEQPTGQVVTFPNSLVLSSGGLGKFNPEGSKPVQPECTEKDPDM